ncbi:MCE family protein [Nocardioides sp.]|uniref:MCE family protein n=1 Tax=Nocardioides sp. TaxID=35761 RepID=UPI0035183D7D
MTGGRRAPAGPLRRGLVPLLAGILLAGCSYEGASSLPLPGGVGTDGYRVSMVFDDVTNLVPAETCRANDVVIGSVESIELDDRLRAVVVCRIDDDVRLAGNAVATLRETSLLGERFVALDPPAGTDPVGTLAPGTVLPAATASVVPDVEVVLGALSQVLNGGGLDALTTISRELTTALSGSDLGATTRRVGRFVDLLDDRRDDLVAGLEALDRLSGTLADQREVIGAALEAVPGGLAVLERQRPRLIRALGALQRLSRTAVPLIRDTRRATRADLEHLAPILDGLADSGDLLARAVEGVVTFPFPSYTKYVTQGDYAGMYGTISFDLDAFNKVLAQHDPRAGTTAGGPDAPTVPGLPGLSGLPELSDLPLEDLLDALPGVVDDALAGAGGEGLLGSLTSPRTTEVGVRRSTVAPRTLADLLTGGAR